MNVEQIALQRKPAGGDGVADPREGQEIGERQAHHFGFDAAQAPLGRFARGGERRSADLDPRGDEVARLGRGAVGHRLDAAALAVAKHHDAADLQHLDPEFERSARAVMAGVRAIERHEGGDVAHDEQFAGQARNTVCGSTRESEQATTIASGLCPQWASAS